MTMIHHTYAKVPSLAEEVAVVDSRAEEVDRIAVVVAVLVFTLVQ
jgi:hypothetical protein